MATCHHAQDAKGEDEGDRQEKERVELLPRQRRHTKEGWRDIPWKNRLRQSTPREEGERSSNVN